MTTKEQQSIDSLHKAIQEFKNANDKFREDVKVLVEGMNKKVDEKHLPLSLEKQVHVSIEAALSKSLSDAMSGYNSPLLKYAHNVVAKYQTQIEKVFDEVVQEGIASAEFKERVREVLLHKIAKTIISGIDGSVDKTINLMKQDQVFRGRLTLAVNDLVQEFLTRKP
jgi:Fe2+ transport system protein B